MNPQRWTQVKALYAATLERPERERSSFLAAECGVDEELRGEIESLLAARDEADARLEPPSPGGICASPESPPDAMIGRRIGPYTLVAVLGYGGMGTVYEAEQEAPKRRVALKIIRGGPRVDRQTVRLFRREVQALALLNHPHIAAFHEAGSTDEGEHYFVMELVKGVPLNEYVQQVEKSKNRKVEIEEKLALFSQVCAGIAYAHQRGVIHRDLKPSNILVAEGNAEKPKSPNAEKPSAPLILSDSAFRIPHSALPKILDFGLARITDADVSLSTFNVEVGKLQGTLAYMSPEQTLGRAEDIDLRSDVYSLGVVLYELLTGRLPYQVRDVPLPLALRAIRENPPTRPGALERRLHGDLETILLKALEKEPARRYQSAAALAEDLQRFRRNDPILARPSSTAYQLKKLVKRHKLATALIAATFTVAVGIAATVTVLYGRAQSNLARAIEAEADSSARADTNEQIVEFMISLFRTPSPGGPERLAITAREVLDRGAARIREELADKPEVQSSLMRAIGQTYEEMGLLAEGGDLLESALSISRRGGSEDRAVADSLVKLAWLRFRANDGRQAETLIREAIAVYERLNLHETAGRAEALSHLGYFLSVRGAVAEARPILEQALALEQRLGGEDGEGALRVQSALVGRALRAKDYGEAERLVRGLIESIRRAYPDDHTNLATDLDLLGLILIKQGRHAEAEDVLRESKAINLRIRGRQGWVSNCVTNLGLALMEQGRYDEAEVELLEALDLAPTEWYPPLGLGQNYLRRGRLTLAAPLLRRAAELCQSIYGSCDSRVHEAADLLGECLLGQERWAEAEQHFCERVEACEASAGSDGSSLAAPLLGRGRALMGLGQLTLAESLIRHGLWIRERAPAGTSIGLAEARSVLGECLALLGRHEEAELLLLESFQVIETGRPATDWHHAVALGRLVRLYEAWGRPEQAAEWRTRLAEWQASTQPVAR